jgi:acyl-CoA synthetase (AMP-forming)/AMP-acid ligase II
VFKQLEERFKAPVIEAYAMTENSHQMTSNQLPPGKRKPGSVGQGTGTRSPPPTHHLQLSSADAVCGGACAVVRVRVRSVKGWR